MTAPAIQALFGDPEAGRGVEVGVDETLVLDIVAMGVVGPALEVLEAIELADVVVAASSRYIVFAFHPTRQP